MNYSESMSKRQQRRKALNQRFRRMFLVALLMGLAMGFIFGRCSAVNSKAPDAPIEPDQLTAVTPDVTLEPVEPPLVEEPAEPEPVLLGGFRITAYCSCEKCCGEWAKNRPNGIVYGAAGVELKAGVSCASPLPLGTVVEVEGLGEYIVQDRPAQWVIDKYGENQIDIYFDNHEITCETAGEAGNDYTGTVIPIEYVDGLETCSISAVVIPGEDEEDTEVFRQRYMDSLNAQAFGGNRADYLEKVNAIPGVGGVKVYRVWNSDLNPAKLIPPTGTDTWISGLSGVSEEIKAWLDAVYAAGANSKLTVGGTVKLVIINSSFKKPSKTLVGQVQTAVDPLQNAGEGVGIAPIGHVVRVEGVGEDTINLSFDLYYQREWSWDDVSAYVTEAINGYFLELAQSWADQNEALVVRISQVESRLLGITGILDIANTKINGEAANCTLTLDHIPVLGTIEPGTIVING